MVPIAHADVLQPLRKLHDSCMLDLMMLPVVDQRFLPDANMPCLMHGPLAALNTMVQIFDLLR